MRNFKSLNIWQDGLTIVKHVYQIASLLPNVEKYGLRSQICRSAVSIPSNIAEGCSRSSQKDFKRFLEIALGSSYELETQLLIIEELTLFTEGELGNIIERINKIQKMMNRLITKLKTISR